MMYPEIDMPACQVGNGSVLTWLRWPVCSLLLLCASGPWAAEREGISDEALGKLTGRAMSEFSVPGMAIGIVKANKIVLAKGFGVRELGKAGKIDSDTLFKIASNSKAFTTAALAILVEDGLISWDGLVIDYIPEFRMHDPWVTAGFTVTDLLTHRSGLQSFVGDMLLWPEPNSFTRADIIHALRYFKPVSGFRTEYAYDNLLYIVAGEIVPRVSDKSWGEFVESRIMRPAGMKRCFASKIPKKEMKNIAAPHGVIEGQLSVIERGRIPRQPPISAAAGGVVCSLDDMLTWAMIQLNRGATTTGLKLFSAAQSEELWQPRTLRTVSERDFKFYRTHFKAYGLGWRLADVHGFKQVSHTGTLAGMKSYVVLIPELELGIVLLSNGSSSTARSAVMNTIVRSFMPVEQVDWIQVLTDEIEARRQEEELTATGAEQAAEAPAKKVLEACCVPDYSLFTGRYRDPWFGDVTIHLKEDKLIFTSDRSPKLLGDMFHHDGNRFVVRWVDRTLEADAYVLFERDGDGRTIAMSMSKLDDGDFDFEDLNFSWVE